MLPDLRLDAESPSAVATHLAGNDFDVVRLPVAASSTGAALEIVSRWTRGATIVAQRLRTPTGIRTHRVHLSSRRPGDGLDNFVRFVAQSADGSTVLDFNFGLCPTGNSVIDPLRAASLLPKLHSTTCGHPLTQYARWGFEPGWARTLPSLYISRLPVGRYGVTITIDPARLLLDRNRRNNTIRLALDVTDRTVNVFPSSPYSLAARPFVVEREPGGRRAPVPPPRVRPDLRVLPATGISTLSRAGRDRVRFDATVWNAGPRLVIEARRPAQIDGQTPDGSSMVARQLFMTGDRVTASRRVGQLHFTPSDSHQHWHLHNFAVYRLRGAQGQVARSSETGFCFFNTDPIDLSLPRAPTAPTQFTDPYALETRCGNRAARSTYMGLDTGWGDTYPGDYGGQSFDITDLPNGKYVIEIAVDPFRKLFLRTPVRDVSRRIVYLIGTPGARVACVPPWRGIETETSMPAQCRPAPPAPLP